MNLVLFCTQIVWKCLDSKYFVDLVIFERFLNSKEHKFSEFACCNNLVKISALMKSHKGFEQDFEMRKFGNLLSATIKGKVI